MGRYFDLKRTNDRLPLIRGALITIGVIWITAMIVFPNIPSGVLIGLGIVYMAMIAGGLGVVPWVHGRRNAQAAKVFAASNAINYLRSAFDEHIHGLAEGFTVCPPGTQMAVLLRGQVGFTSASYAPPVVDAEGDCRIGPRVNLKAVWSSTAALAVYRHVDGALFAVLFVPAKADMEHHVQIKSPDGEPCSYISCESAGPLEQSA